MQEAGYQIPTKNVATDFLEKILSRKCKIHKNQPCEHIHLKPSEFSPRLCCECMEDRGIPLNEAISIRLLLQATETTTFKSYPKFTDNSIYQKIQDLKGSQERISRDSSSFFDKLNSEVSQAIEKAKLAQKQQLTCLSDSYQDVFSSFSQILKIDQFKQLINDSNENEEKLCGFIQTQYSQINNYTEMMNNKILDYQKIEQSFQLTEANKKLQEIIKLIESITLFSFQTSNQQQRQPLFQQQNQVEQQFQWNNQPVQKATQQKEQLQQQQEKQQQNFREEEQQKQQLRQKDQKEQQILSSSQFDYDCYLSLYVQVSKKQLHQQALHQLQLQQAQALQLHQQALDYQSYKQALQQLQLQQAQAQALQLQQAYQSQQAQYDQEKWQALTQEKKEDVIRQLKKILDN